VTDPAVHRPPLHAATTPLPDDATRALTKELADLCRRDSARFAEVVRLSDHLERLGTPKHQAIRQALDTP
jgi:hypothetical protein